MSDDDKTLAKKFRRLFYGNKSSIGRHIYSDTGASDTATSEQDKNEQDKNGKGEKREGKSYVEKTPLTDTHYLQHLRGKRIGLGVSPILKGNRCRFSAIDIDIYGSSGRTLIRRVVASIYKWQLPIWPFYSKSGGLHLYMFFADEDSSKEELYGIQASSAIGFCNIFAKLLLNRDIKYEVFPKQAQVVDGSIGNWINLPYYGALAEQNNPVQTLINSTLEKVDILSAIDTLSESNPYSQEGLEEYMNSLPFFDGPPCLQQITTQLGPSEGEGRNIFLFNSSIYFKEKDPKVFDSQLRDLNSNMQEPLEDREVSQILASVIKREYHYECNKEPLHSFCDRESCATKKFGVGKNNGSFMGVATGPLIIQRGKGKSYSWEVSREDKSAYLHFDSPKELMDQTVFIGQVLQELDFKASRVKAEKWDRILNNALKTPKFQDVNFHDDNSYEARIIKTIVQRITQNYYPDTDEERVPYIEKGFVIRRIAKEDLLFKADHIWNYLTVVKREKISNALFQKILKELPCRQLVTRLPGMDKSVRVRSLSVDDAEKLLGRSIDVQENVSWSESEEDSEF